MNTKLKPLYIGDLKIEIPIIQGGMGVKVSTAALASAVAICGAAGTISSVALGFGTEEHHTDYLKSSRDALRQEIRKAKAITDGPVGVNIMIALSNYQELMQVSVEEKVDFIASGAGLPMDLPKFAKGSSTKLIPIVSSARAAQLIIRTWARKFNRTPDAIIVEGPLAGGHLGFKPEEVVNPEAGSLERIVTDVIQAVKDKNIPVIAAGGIFDGKDIARFLKLGASGVQIASRFVATDECDVALAFKQQYVNAKEEDIVIIKSPVGLPGRSVRTKFVNAMLNGGRDPFACSYRCLRTCVPREAPYCIAKALCNAAAGDIDHAVVFAGSNVSRITKIVPVKELIDELVTDTLACLNQSAPEPATVSA